MLNQIMLQSLMSFFVTDLRMHGEEIRKLSRHLVINIGKRTLVIIWLIIVHWL